MRTTPEQRLLIAKAIERGKDINIVADIFGVSQKTVRRWSNRKRFTDRIRKPKQSKITLETELAILAIRTTFKWGTARIQQGLLNLPAYAKKALQNTVENVHLSRTAINNVLKKHKLNGYQNESKRWKFFRAKKPDELWQLDPKGPFIIQGEKYWFIICIDDYSRYMLIAEQLDHSPKTENITNMLDKLKKKPEKILTDNAKLFSKKWERWCFFNGIKPLYAHPYYPQDKGKVERAIRNISEEFIHLMVKFPEWLNGVIGDYKEWFNNFRFHRGIGTVPSALYVALET